MERLFKAGILLMASSFALFASIGYGGAKPTVAGSGVVAPDMAPDEGPSDARQSEYKLQVEDVIEVKFFYTPELNDRVIIRPDGKISLNLLDDVYVAGMTPSELDEYLTEKYSRFLKDPELTVFVKKFASHRIYVGGEVNIPGMIPLKVNLTTLQAIFQAGGFRNTAESSNIILLRNSGGGHPEVIIVDLKADLSRKTSNGETQRANDIFLQPYDVVFVPKTRIAKVNQFVEQYIKKALPISLNMGFSYIYNIRPKVEVREVR